MSEIDDMLSRAMPDIARRLQNELILAAPVSGGRLIPSITVIPTEKGVVITMAEHGMFVEFGTPPHVIKAKDGKVLHWHKTKGRTQHSHPHSKAMAEDAVFAKEVKHPGSRPNPFIRNTIQNKLRNIIHEELMKV